MINSQSYKCIPFTASISELAKEHEVDLSGLPKALARAVQEGLQIAPVSAHSKFASLTRSCLASPTSNPRLIASRTAQFPEANWCVRTGRGSNLVILEVSHDTGQDSLCDLGEDSWDTWSDTLRFHDDLATSFLFHYPTRRIRHLSWQFQGLRIHAGNLVLLPPSWFASGPPLRYFSLDLEILDCPPFLLEAGSEERNPARVIPFPQNRTL